MGRDRKTDGDRDWHGEWDGYGIGHADTMKRRSKPTCHLWVAPMAMTVKDFENAGASSHHCSVCAACSQDLIWPTYVDT